MSNNRNLSKFANILDNAANGQLLISDGNGGVIFGTASGGGGGGGDALGTVTGADLDLSTGNFFEVTADDQTLTFSNPPAAHGFTLKVTGAGTVSGYDLSVASYDSVSFRVNEQDKSPYGIKFNLDGTKMFIVGNDTSSMYQYTLTTGFDLSTASYDSVSLSVAAQDTALRGAAFSADGTKMFVAGSQTSTIYQYSLTTAFDLSTASYDAVSFSVVAQETVPVGIAFITDGTKMFIVGFISDNVHQYTLTTAFDISTASYDDISFAIAQENAPSMLVFNATGTRMLVGGASSDAVYQYTLTTGFDVSTASYDTVSFNVAAQETSPRGIAFSPDGSKMFIVGSASDTVYQYTTGAFTTATITYPASVTFEAGSPPAAPAIGAVKTVDLYTVNGGTNYYDKG